jgi:serine/threonine protein kinase
MTNSSPSPKGSTKKIGTFTIQAAIGRGRFGSVVLAISEDGRKYAIKILHKDFGKNPKIKEALANWVQIMNALDSTGIVQIFELGFEREYPYLVMPIMHGRSLAHRLKKERLSPEQTHDILLHVATTLRQLHDREFVHGSLHPHNILFHKTGIPLLTDVGLATILAPERHESVNLPGYLSPEQIKGERADGRTDSYALGIILYEMLTGHPAYTADSAAMITVKQMQSPVASVQLHQPDLSPTYDGLIGRLTAAQINQRPQTAGMMFELIQATLRRVTGIEEYDSDLGKDIFNKVAGHVKKEDTLEQRMAAIQEIRNLKYIEEESSQRRMSELVAIEEERKRIVRAQQQKTAQTEKSKVVIAIVILVSFIFLFLLVTVIQTIR